MTENLDVHVLMTTIYDGELQGSLQAYSAKYRIGDWAVIAKWRHVMNASRPIGIEPDPNPKGGRWLVLHVPTGMELDTHIATNRLSIAKWAADVAHHTFPSPLTPTRDRAKAAALVAARDAIRRVVNEREAGHVTKRERCPYCGTEQDVVRPHPRIESRPDLDHPRCIYCASHLPEPVQPTERNWRGEPAEVCPTCGGRDTHKVDDETRECAHCGEYAVESGK